MGTQKVEKLWPIELWEGKPSVFLSVVKSGPCYLAFTSYFSWFCTHHAEGHVTVGGCTAVLTRTAIACGSGESLWEALWRGWTDRDAEGRGESGHELLWGSGQGIASVGQAHAHNRGGPGPEQTSLKGCLPGSLI